MLLIFRLLLTFQLFGNALGAVPDRCAFFIQNSHLTYASELSASEKIARIKQASAPDHSPFGHPEKRIKIVTSGERKYFTGNLDPSAIVIDTADPSIPFYYNWGNGKSEIRVSLSDGEYLIYPDLKTYEHGGPGHVVRVRSFYNNGTEMNGANAPLPWDTELYILPNGEMIGHGGAIITSSPGVPTEEEGPRRSRMWAHVVRDELPDGSIDEKWYYKASIIPLDVPVDNDWIQPHHHHSYGGTVLKDQSGTPILNANGNYIYFYDMVDRQKDNQPWRTSIYVSEMDSSMQQLVGKSHLVHDGINPRTKKPYPLAMRTFGGSLIEGFRPLLQATYVSPGLVKLSNGKVVSLDQAELAGTASPGDYVAHYGMAMLYKPPTQKILSRYQMVENENGTDLRDLANFYRDYMGLTWVGRASPYYNSEVGAWRIAFHAIPLTQFSLGQPTTGWPSPDEAKKLHRQVLWSPILIERNSKGQFIFTPDIPDQKNNPF